MSKASPTSNTRAWLPVFIYILVIFALTPFLPKITKSAAHLFNLPIKQLDIWLRNIVIVGLSGFLIAFMIYRGRYKQQSTYVALVIIFVWGAKLVGGFGAPVEATHFLEYGALAVLVFYKLRYRYIEVRSAPLYLTAALFTLVVGALDELYQGWLPDRFTRYYDFNDIVTNGSSGVMGLIYVWGVMRPGPLRERIGSILKGGRKGADFQISKTA
jgi:VanZ family protein